MSKLISVVIPVYNAEKYLHDCLNSLFSQCNEEVEVVLVNDGSKDSSRLICEEFIKGNPSVDVKLVNQGNSGSLRSRVNGVANATGKYILFMDSDDLLLDHALEALLGVLHEKNCDMVFFNYTRDLTTKEPAINYPFEHGKYFTEDDRYTAYKLLCGSDSLNNLWNKCMRKALFQKSSLPEKGQRLTMGEDLFQILDMVDKARWIVYLDQVLYYYRVLANSLSRIYNPYYFNSVKAMSIKRLEYAEKWDKTNELIESSHFQTYKALRETARKLFVSDFCWNEFKLEMQRLRNDSFFRENYIRRHYGFNYRDFVYKSPFPIMHIARLLLHLSR